MSTISAHQDCSITFDSGDTIELSNIDFDIDTASTMITTTNPYIIGNITISGGGAGSSSVYTTGAGVGGGSYTIASGMNAASIGPITISDLESYVIQEEWENSFPDFNRVKKMCEEYPGLKIAYEKFVTTYKLVKDHYDTPKDQRPKP